ncbi:uncharacterized protein LOC135336830 isoform X2 [Halichondria panicea]|uniref:uncharacterized protein LOC135336830 isoform X2 n=1 Tax=Halichondria panicea TaxID=6063 RepID=UPI00312B2F86
MRLAVPTIVTLLFLATPILVLSLRHCSRSRLDLYPCNPDVIVPMPNRNQYGVYSTRIRGNVGSEYCVLRKSGHFIQDIDTIATADIMLLFSPGFQLQPKKNYLNEMIVEYNIDCGPGKSAYLSINELDLEPRNCHISERDQCQDYIEVKSGNGGKREFCGNDKGDMFFATGSFKARLRTSKRVNFLGFSASVICFNMDPPSSQRTSINRRPESNSGSCTHVQPNDLFAKSSRLNKIAESSYIEVLQSEDTAKLKPLENTTPSAPTLKLTSSEKKVLDMLLDPLIRNGLKAAEKHAPSVWPPVEFDDDIDDDVSFLGLTKKPTDRIIIPPPPTLAPYYKRRSTLGPRDYYRRSVSQDLEVNRVAVAYQEACNPVLKAATNSILNVVKRSTPFY